MERSYLGAIVLVFLLVILVLAVLLIGNPFGPSNGDAGDAGSIDSLVDRSERLAADFRSTRALAQASLGNSEVLKGSRLLGLGLGLAAGFGGGAYLSFLRERRERR